MRAIGKVILYLLLATGAAVFSFPFLWMASGSVKVDREVQTKDFRLMPITPIPQRRSPYVDDRFYAELEGPCQAELLAALERIVERTGFRPPPTVNAEAARREVACGLYVKLRARLPQTLWDPPGGATGARQAVALAAAAEKEVTRPMAEDVFAGVYRRLCLGPVRVGTETGREIELGAGAKGPLSKRLTNRSPEVVTVVDVVEESEPFALLRYDFGDADRFVLTAVYDLPPGLDANSVRRISLDVRPDDTWHELYLTAELGGVRYEAQRPWPLANLEVTKVSWQPPGPDDVSTKIRTWIGLVPSGQAEAANVVKLTLEFRRSGQGGAWWNKLKLNYQRTLDQVPFWRYLRVSLFLVVANIVLMLLISSLVAYAFARLNWPGRQLSFVLMLATMMIPFQVTMIPQFLIWKNIGAYDTLTPLWLGPAFGSAFFIFLLRQSLKTIPTDLEDAARLDGCGSLRIYWHIMLPLIKPSLAAIAIFTFLDTWNNFMGPLIYIADQRLYPLAFGLYAFSVQVSNDPALTMAASLLMTVPVIVIFFFSQKYFIQGVTLTGIKG